jgi:hypothetical protein
LFHKFGTTAIGFADVGAGGALKAPWRLLPPECVNKFDFEPTDSGAPLCISDRSGHAEFHVAIDSCASSLHRPLSEFVDRFGFSGMHTKQTITVDCTSLDRYFAGRYKDVDAMDVNVEGHDYQVLQGAAQLLGAGGLKLLKIEFELVPAYEGQKYFADIDECLRAHQFRLAHIQVDHVRPAKVRSLYHEGESIWGKALYAPTAALLTSQLPDVQHTRGTAAARRELGAGIGLYAAARIPGFAYDSIQIGESIGLLSDAESAWIRHEFERAFRWAKLETGLNRLGNLARSVLGVAARAS